MKRIILALFACTISIAGPVHSQESESSTAVEVNVDITQDPIKIIGFVLRNGESSQVAVANWKRVNDRTVVAEVPVSSEALREDTTVTVMAIGDKGDVKYGDVRVASSEPSVFNLPTCPEQIAPKNIASQTGLVQALVDVRTARRNFLELKLAKTLDEKLIDTLMKLEKGFGIHSSEAIDPTLHPTILADRLSRIEAAIQNYRAKKAPQK